MCDDFFGSFQKVTLQNNYWPFGKVPLIFYLQITAFYKIDTRFHLRLTALLNYNNPAEWWTTIKFSLFQPVHPTILANLQSGMLCSLSASIFLHLCLIASVSYSWSATRCFKQGTVYYSILVVWYFQPIPSIIPFTFTWTKTFHCDAEGEVEYLL